MMRAAFATWNERIAPVFDVARHIHIVDAASGRISSEALENLAEELPAQRALRLAEWGVSMLVCGAISRPMQAMVEAYGISVVAFVAGDLQEIIKAWLSGLLRTDTFAMPGCRRGGRGLGRKALRGHQRDGRGRGLSR